MNHSSQLTACLLAIVVAWAPQPIQAYTCVGASSFRVEMRDVENIFVARITSSGIPEGGQRGDVTAEFEVVEHFKGDIPFDHLTTPSDFQFGGIAFVVGAQYLIMTSDSGDVDTCGTFSAVAPMELRQDKFIEAKLEALRAAKANGFRQLVAPWQFAESEMSDGLRVCGVSHEMAFEGIDGGESSSIGGATLLVVGGKHPESHRAPEWPSISFVVAVPRGKTAPSTQLTLRLDTFRYKLALTPVRERDRAHRYYAGREDINRILGDLASAPEIRLRAGRVSARAHAHTIGPSLKQLNDCIERLRLLN